MEPIVQGFNTDYGVAKYDYESLANLPEQVIPKDGKDGADGKDGMDGKDGASAYELAVKAGFSGSEAEWLASLKGKDGTNGKNGTNGKDGSDASLTEEEKSQLATLRSIVQLDVGDGLTKASQEGKVVFGLEGLYIKQLIADLIRQDFPELFEPYELFANAASFTADGDDNNWYDFKDTARGCIYFNEPSETTAPSFLSEPNFRDAKVPAYTISLSKPLNLIKTPVMQVKMVTLGICPFEFMFIDSEGHKSTPIAIGHFDNGSQTEITVNSATLQTAAEQSAVGAPNKITSINTGAYNYTKATTVSARDTQTDSVLADIAAGNVSKFASGEVNILNGMLNGFHYDEGFDYSHITGLYVQQVEFSDKATITYKARTKSVVFAQFQFVPVSLGDKEGA